MRTKKIPYEKVISYGKKPKKFRVYIQERSVDDRIGDTSSCITILDYKHKLTAKKIKDKLYKSLKREFK